MDLNKLTKKELIEHAKSIDIDVYKGETKADIIKTLNRYTYANCAGCNKKLNSSLFTLKTKSLNLISSASIVLVSSSYSPIMSSSKYHSLFLPGGTNSAKFPFS